MSALAPICRIGVISGIGEQGAEVDPLPLLSQWRHSGGIFGSLAGDCKIDRIFAIGVLTADVDQGRSGEGLVTLSSVLATLGFRLPESSNFRNLVTGTRRPPPPL